MPCRISAWRATTSRQRGLIHLHRVAFQQARVRRHDVAETDADDIARHQLTRRGRDPLAVTLHRGLDRQRGLQGGDGVARLVLFPESDHGVGQKQNEDDAEIRPMPVHRRKDHGRFDHPRDGTPKIAEEFQTSFSLLLLHKRTEATVMGADGKQFKVAKGAPQVILALSANAGEVKPAVDKAVNEFAARGFRSLGVARAEGDGKWQFLGVLPLFDPPRDDAKATIATAREMGVSVKMVTGDALAIAQETAKKLGMGANILDASGFGDSKRHETAALAES